MKDRVIINKDRAGKYLCFLIDAPIMKNKDTATSNLQKVIMGMNVNLLNANSM